MTRSLFLALAIVAAGCSSGDPGAEIFDARVDALQAPAGGGFTLYSLRADSLISAADSATTLWDLGFRGTDVILNGGVSGPGAGVGVVVDVEASAIEDALNDEFVYRRDGESPCPSGPARAVCRAPGDGWYTLRDGDVVPIAGRTLLLRLGDGQGYARVTFEAYDDATATYTLDVTVNPEGSSFVPDE